MQDASTSSSLGGPPREPSVELEGAPRYELASIRPCGALCARDDSQARHRPHRHLRSRCGGGERGLCAAPNAVALPSRPWADHHAPRRSGSLERFASLSTERARRCRRNRPRERRGAGLGMGRGGRRRVSRNVKVNDRLPPERIQKVVRAAKAEVRRCYENGLRSSPSLAGRVVVRFVIDREGRVESAKDEGSDPVDKAVVGCVVNVYAKLTFPRPDGGSLAVVYPIAFSPGD